MPRTNDAERIKAGDPRRVPGSGPLVFVEMGRNSDDRSGDRILEVDLSVPLQLQQYPSADLRRQVRGPVDLDVPVRTHVALDRPDGALRAGDGLTLGRVTHQKSTALTRCDNRRRDRRRFSVGDHQSLEVSQCSNHRVRGTKVNANSFRDLATPVDDNQALAGKT